ncbi:MAG: hypothetical protein Ct9H300mP8_04970 [Gammaproteobacteria bacterium]|nr:MAG: hypothetical protein Ct9H300mP8_04970 [Gammaproteobacteria bacterium]
MRLKNDVTYTVLRSSVQRNCRHLFLCQNLPLVLAGNSRRAGQINGAQGLALLGSTNRVTRSGLDPRSIHGVVTSRHKASSGASRYSFLRVSKFARSLIPGLCPTMAAQRMSPRLPEGSQ